MGTTTALPRSRPLLIYGTAWEDRTAELTNAGLLAGFRAIDTANYPTAYNETLTGEGVQAAIAAGIKREDLLVSLPTYLRHLCMFHIWAIINCWKRLYLEIHETDRKYK